MTIVIVKEALSGPEYRELVECEATIKKGIDATAEVIRALETIRDKRLFKADYKTFGAYLRKKWGKSDRHFRRLAAWLEVSENLERGPVGPLTERQTREIAALDPERQAQIAQQAQTDGDLSSTHLRQLVSGVWDRLSPEEQCRLTEEEDDEALESEPAARQVGGDNWKERQARGLKKLASARREFEGIGGPGEATVTAIDKAIKAGQAVAA